jgi:hypothetical protein
VEHGEGEAGRSATRPSSGSARRRAKAHTN